MRTFTVTCPGCDTDLDVEIEESDLLDPDVIHVTTCETCKSELGCEYDAEIDDLNLVTLEPGENEDEEEDEEEIKDEDEDDDDAEDEA